MARTVNRLTNRDALLSSNPETGLSIPLTSKDVYSSSVAFYDQVDTTFLIPTDYEFSVDERVSVTAASGDFPIFGSISGERLITVAESYGERTNLVYNPSFEVGSASTWYINPALGSASITSVDSWSGSVSAMVMPATSPGDIEFRSSVLYGMPIQEDGAYLRATAMVKSGPGVECAYRLAFTWYEGGSVLFSELGPIKSEIDESSGWTKLEYIELSPATADSCLVWVLANGTNGTLEPGQYILVDAVMVENAPADDPEFLYSKSRPYFDGSTGYSQWTSTPGLSTSTIQPLKVIEFQTPESLNTVSEFTRVSMSAEITPIYSHRWLASNASIRTVSQNFETTSRYVLLINTPSISPVKIKLSNTRLLRSDTLRRFQFNAKMYTNSTCTISGKLALTGELESATAVNTIVYGGRYSAIRTNTLVLPDVNDSTNPYYYSDYIDVDIEITISNHRPGDFYLTLPHLVDDQLYYSNWFVQSARFLMPDFMWDYDFEQENPKAPMFKLLDSMMAIAGDTRDEYVDATEYEKIELENLALQVEPEYRSALVNPLYAKNDYLPWLSQFVGTKLKRNITGANGQKLLPNTETENEYARWQANTGYYGLNAGTRQAVTEAARQALVFTKDGEPPTKAVAVTSRLDGNTFTIGIQTLLNETMDVVNEGESSQFILDAVEPARPLGYKIVHTTTEVFEFTLGNETLGVIGNVGLG